MNFFERFIQTFTPSEPGFIFMWILVFISVCAAVLILRRALFLRQSANLETAGFMSRIYQLIQEQKSDEAVRLCDSAGKRALPWVLKGAILKAESDARGIQTVIEERIVSIIPRLEKELNYIATIGNISTLVGLMGTIYGLILAFAAVGSPDIDPAMKSSMLADGISAAMNTTLLGLIIAIPCILSYTYFRNTVAAIVNEIDRYTVGLAHKLAPDEVLHKGYKPSERKTKDAIDSEPNMVPIMGLMVVLVPLLLSTSEFVKMGSVPINLPQAADGGEGGSQEEKAPPKMLNLGIVITAKGTSLMRSYDDATKKPAAPEGQETLPDIPVLTPGVQDFEALNKKLADMKLRVLGDLIGQKNPKSFGAAYHAWAAEAEKTDFYDYKDHYNVKILAENAISYQAVVRVMDAARKYTDTDREEYLLFPVVSMGVMR